MKTKLIGIVVTTLLIGTAVLPVVGSINIEKNQLVEKKITDETGSSFYYSDQLDQQSTKDDDSRLITVFHLAQGFVPSLPKLTRVDLLLSKTSGDAMYESYIVEIRKEDLTSTTLTSAGLDQSFINTGRNWVEFDFPDIDVDVGSTYYIIIHGETSTGDTASVSWRYGYPNPYPNGDAYRNTPGGWFLLDHSGQAVDFCFKTYGISDNIPPNKPTINGPTKGKPDEMITFTASTIDQDGDKIFYWCDWGDNTNSGWKGPINSGQSIELSHKWLEVGSYQIRVKTKDIHDAESSWSDPLSISIPKSRFYNKTPFLNFLQNHPHLSPILRHLLGL